MPFAESPDSILFEHKRDIVERSDVDRDATATAVREHLRDEDQYDDWGDGWFVNHEPVIVSRGRDGEIVRTTPLSELHEMGILRQEGEEDAEPMIGRARPEPTPLTTEDREKLVTILAVRLFKYYAAQGQSPTKYNPIWDGIPDLPPGAPENLQPRPGTPLYPATKGEVLEWMKTKVVAPRVKVQNRKLGRSGYVPSLSISRDPV